MDDYDDIQRRRFGNEALLILKKANLNLADFERAEVPGSPWFKIVYKPNKDYFSFGTIVNASATWKRPGEKLSQNSNPGAPWQEKMKLFSGWVELLQKFLTALEVHSNTPDLWSAISEELLVDQFRRSSDNDNAPFTSGEQGYISKQLEELESFIITTSNPTMHQLGEISARLGYLEEASGRMGRKDWNGVLLGTLLSIVVAGVFAPDRAHELFAFAWSLFASLYGALIQLPPN